MWVLWQQRQYMQSAELMKISYHECNRLVTICSLERPKPKILASHVEEFLPLQQLATDLPTNYRQTQVIHLMGIRSNYYIRWQQYGKTKPESARGESGGIKLN